MDPNTPSNDVLISTPSLDVKVLMEMLENATALLLQVKNALDQYARGKSASAASAYSPLSVGSPTSDARPVAPAYTETTNSLDRVVEGVFNGSSMVGMDGKMYQVPPNYASKSKLVEGDRLKLIIRENGMFVYKQIAPMDRERLMGVLERSEDGHGFVVRVGDRQYAVLLASVTYYHGEVGDEVILLTPRGASSHWGAVENIIRNTHSFNPSSFTPSSPPSSSPTPSSLSSLAPAPTPTKPLSGEDAERSIRPAGLGDPLTSDLDTLLSDFPRSSTSPSPSV